MVEAGHIELVHRVSRRIASHYRRLEGHRRLGVRHAAPAVSWRQREPNHLASHLILKARIRKKHSGLEPRYRIEP
jgi:hypothetical protein